MLVYTQISRNEMALQDFHYSCSIQGFINTRSVRFHGEWIVMLACRQIHKMRKDMDKSHKKRNKYEIVLFHYIPQLQGRRLFL